MEVVQPAAFDASVLQPESDSQVVDILHPQTRKKTGIRITVYSRDSEMYRDLQKKQQNIRFKQFGRRTTSSSLTAEELEEDSMALLIACTKSWETIVKTDGVESSVPSIFYGGEDLKLTPGNAKLLYERIPTIREQVDDGIHDRANFMKR